MAPRPPTQPKRPTARAKALARLRDPLLPRKLHRPDNAVTDSFADTKRDRRQIRRSAFVSRIAKSAPGSGGGAAQKRRRPNKKLVATLESLGDALGDIEVAPRGDDGEQDGARGKVRHRSIASRPGALRRKEKVVRGEMERFSRSLAQLATLPGAGGKGEGGAAAAAEAMETEAAGVAAAVPASASSSSTSSRFAALRGFITATMEQNPAFVGKG
ncbi:ribosome biogenesis protein SLX9-domain-containing protein [Phialemonium atrogriseum]|uniref:Ribosome biogenesis protein SLX9 n=1 Tax=Phialemonium atrogriseum TaxID=1093897 RepID=A0AAJ0C4L2_9PEZI|nr:ribosome biogenesis protein SLX9-domain-containing protein [Phialemonium atrogriseum]KAK1770060.1 ribosome biogenesis protein SLX9-domain-containing protein [Phialemonium atrogriseum]